MSGGWGGAREGSGRKPADYVPSEDKVNFDKERAEHERVKRLQREFKLAQERGDYVLRTSVRQASATALALLNQTLGAIPDNCERKFNLPPEVVEQIDAEVKAALAEVASMFRAVAPEVP